MLKGLPMLGQALRQFRTPTSSFWRGVLPHAARGVAVQNAQEFGQDITTPVVQNIVAALKQDVPHVDWDSQLGGWNGRVETFIALLPFALFGAGVQTRRENALVQRSLHEPELLAYAGFDADTAAQIVETARTDEDAAETLFRAGWLVRRAEDIARGVALYEERAARAQALQQSPETPTVRRTADDRFELRDPGGALVATFETEDAAVAAATDTVRAQLEQADQGVREMVAFFAERDPQRQFEIIDQARTLRDEFDAIADPAERARVLPRLLERMRIAGIAVQDADPEASLGTAWVLGENQTLVRDQAWQSVSKLYRGASWATVVEETAEGFTKEALQNGRVTKPTLESWLRGVQAQLGTPFFAGEVATDQELIEGLSRTATAYMAGNLRQEGLAPGLRGVLQQFMVFFRETFRLAGGLLRLRAQGKLDTDFESFLAESVGLRPTEKTTTTELENPAASSGERAMLSTYSVSP